MPESSPSLVLKLRDTLTKGLNILLVPLVAFVITLKLQEIFNVNVVIIIATITYLLKNVFLDGLHTPTLQLNSLDFAVGMLTLTELLSFSQSTYQANSFYYLVEALFFLLFYCLVKFNLRHDYQRIAIFIFITLLGVIFSGVAFTAFYSLYRRLQFLGFNDVTDFRNHIYALTPIGLSIGEWVTVFFLLLPFPIALLIRFKRSRLARCLLIISIVVLVLVMMLTFIRGVYIAFAAFLVVGSALFNAYRLFSIKQIVAFDLLILVLVSLLLIPVMKPVLTTVSLFKTTSQVRSFETRKTVWKDSVAMIKDHFWFGVGSYNFPMQYVSYRSQAEDPTFALRSFNYFLQIVIEKGALGLLAYCWLIVSFYRTSHRKVIALGADVYQKSVVVLFMVAYMAIIVRDFSESSILVNRGVTVLACFMIANNAQLEGQISAAQQSRGGPGPSESFV